MSQKNAVPKHVGFIMDGNRRWAVAQGMRPMKGHEVGVETLKDIVRYGFKEGIDYISVFVFSTENWKRQKVEVDFLMKLILKLFKSELNEFIEEGHRIVVLGSRVGVPKRILHAIDETEDRTRNFTKGTLAICFNYSTAQELEDAGLAIAKDVSEGKEVRPFRNYLYHPEVPDIDLLVRTSGEQRLSGYMLPRANYAELSFVETHWPAFSVDDFKKVMADYAERKRRFGG